MDDSRQPAALEPAALQAVGLARGWVCLGRVREGEFRWRRILRRRLAEASVSIGRPRAGRNCQDAVEGQAAIFVFAQAEVDELAQQAASLRSAERNREA